MQADFKYRFQDLRSTFEYFVNPFICDIIEDGFPISGIIIVEKAAEEFGLL